MVRKRPFMLAIVLSFWLLPLAANAGDIVLYDQSNYKELKGLVPDPVLAWMEKGDWIMRVGDLDFDLAQMRTSWTRQSHKESVGKYDFDEDFVVIDAKTGGPPGFITGLPFPVVDPDDPKAAAKIMYNGYHLRSIDGASEAFFGFSGMNGKTRKEDRYVTMRWNGYPFLGWGPAESIPNPDGKERMDLILVKSPYDMEGTAMMTWRYLDNRQDMLFGYVPAIRRVRRLTPASRSDSMFGTDIVRDDGGTSGYDGKIRDIEWRLLGEGVILGGFHSSVPMRIKVNEHGEWEHPDILDEDRFSVYGWEPQAKKYYKGDVAPWCQVNLIWTKRPVWIIEGIPKDPYYNFGRFIFYMDKEEFSVYWKEMYDRTGDYWKLFWDTWSAAMTEDKSEAHLISTGQVMDEKRYHATNIDIYVPKLGDYKVNAHTLDLNSFSLAGFTRASK
jgi:hypothetical protein